MKTNRLILTGLLSLLIVTSCKKKEDVIATIPSYNNSSVEVNKQKLEDDGLATVQQMKDMKDMQGFSALDEFSSIINTNADIFSNVATKRINRASSFVNAKIEEEETLLLSKAFADEAGTWEYSNTTEEWSKVAESTSKIIYRYQLEGSKKTEITISNFAVKNMSYSEIADISEELPTSLNITIAVEGTTVLAYSFIAEYYTDMVKYSKETLKAEGYALEFITDLKSKSHFKQSSSFTHNNTIIIANSFDLDSSKDYDVIMSDLTGSDNVDPTYNEDNYYEYEEESSLDPTDIINSGNMSFQVGNIKLVGVANVKALISAAQKLDETNFTVAEEVKLYNKFILGYVMFADEATVVAKGEFYEETKTDYGTDPYTTAQYRIVFKDGSAMDDTFFNENFKSVISELESMLDPTPREEY